jgi:hypothetical protein
MVPTDSRSCKAHGPSSGDTRLAGKTYSRTAPAPAPAPAESTRHEKYIAVIITGTVIIVATRWVLVVAFAGPLPFSNAALRICSRTGTGTGTGTGYL